MASLLGEVRLERRVWRCARCGLERAPIDGALGLHGVLSGGAAEAALRLLVELPVRRARDLLERLCGVGVAAATMHRLAGKTGPSAVKMLEEQNHRALAPVSPQCPAATPPAGPAELIVRQADGVMVRFTDDWREVKVGVSYGLGACGEGGQRERMIEPAYCAVRGKGEVLGQQLQALSLGQGLRAAPCSQFVSDGGSWMEPLARGELSWSEWTVDYYHVAQQVASALKALYGEGDPQTTTSFKRLKQMLLKDDGNARVRRSLVARMRRAGPDPAPTHKIENVVKYLERHHEQTRYDRLGEKAWPIGSGCIEGGGCKMYIQQRFKRAGMRWSNEGFTNLEALRRIAYNQSDQLSNILYSRN